MKKLISFPSIDQFKTLVSNVNRQYNYVGLDDKGEAIYDHSKPKPILFLKGTVKLHGCFEKNTPITLANGEEIPISEIKTGMSILSYDVSNNIEIVKKVSKTSSSESNKNWVELVFSDRVIKCTEDHKFYTKNKGLVEAKDLTENDEFITL